MSNIAAIDAERRPLFDRLHRLVLEAVPGVSLSLSYGMPTFRLGSRRLHVGTWKHGVSLYGWGAGGDAGFCDRHPELRSGRGTIQLPIAAATAVGDEELRDLARAALQGG